MSVSYVPGFAACRPYCLFGNIRMRYDAVCYDFRKLTNREAFDQRLVKNCPNSFLQCQVSTSGTTLLDRPMVVIVGGVNDGGGEDQRQEFIILFLVTVVIGGQKQKVEEAGVHLWTQTPTNSVLGARATVR